MKFIIRGKNLEITDSIKNYVEQKLGRLDKYFENPNLIITNVLVRIRGDMQIIEATMSSKKIILRGEESNESLYTSIDLLSDKLERQIRKNKTKMKSIKEKSIISDFKYDIPEIEEEKEKFIVKRKELDMKPMSEEEAILQLELLGHDFFVFKNSDIETISVVYKRKEGNYGIINTK